MQIKVDFFSFTLPVDLRGDTELADKFSFLKEKMIEHGLADFLLFLEGQESSDRAGRGIFKQSLFFPKLHANIYFSGASPFTLFELAGTACAELEAEGLLKNLLLMVGNRATRLDVACDSALFGSPKEFVAHGYGKRFKSRASMTSGDGDTEYVGNMKSDRFARIYRYNEPHPRAGITRVEYVLRDENAKTASAIILQEGLVALASKLGNTFGWESPAWDVSRAEHGKLKTQRNERHGSATLRWIHTAVTPALIKAHREGLLSLDELFTDILNQINQ